MFGKCKIAYMKVPCSLGKGHLWPWELVTSKENYEQFNYFALAAIPFAVIKNANNKILIFWKITYCARVSAFSDHRKLDLSSLFFCFSIFHFSISWNWCEEAAERNRKFFKKWKILKLENKLKSGTSGECRGLILSHDMQFLKILRFC